jgi:hypothetical protein
LINKTLNLHLSPPVDVQDDPPSPSLAGPTNHCVAISCSGVRAETDREPEKNERETSGQIGRGRYKRASGIRSGSNPPVTASARVSPLGPPFPSLSPSPSPLRPSLPSPTRIAATTGPAPPREALSQTNSHGPCDGIVRLSRRSHRPDQTLR